MTELSQVQEVLAAVNRQIGGRYILAGGCIRDLVLGRIPKDYDAFLIGTELDEKYADYADDLVGILAKLGLCDFKVSESYRDCPAGRLAFVVQARLLTTARPVDIDFIAYTSAPTYGWEQVREFDSTINMCYLDPDDEGLVLLPEHPLITGVVQPLRSLDGDWPERRDYLKEKFPQYTYSDEVHN